MSLPPLPKELAAFADNQARHCALNDMVQSYGQACRAAALAELHVPETSFGNIVEPVAWKAEQIDDYEIRVTSPEGEAWRLRCAEKGDIFNNFIWRWAQSMAGGKA